MKNVPFFSNTDDDTHCVQAVFRMALKYFLPKSDFSWQELDRMSKKQPAKGTWWFPMIAEFKKLGINSTYIEAFDYQKYFVEGDSYLEAFYGKETATWFATKSNIKDVRNLIPEFLSGTDLINRPATLTDIIDLLDDGWLVGAEINTKILLGQPGFNGHMVLIYDHKDNDFIVHDPGLPARPHRPIDKQKFSQSWMYSGPEKAALVAFKKGN